MLLSHDLAALEKVAGTNLAAKVLVFELFNRFIVLESYPDIDPPVVIRVGFLPYDLALFIKEAQIKKTITIAIPFLAHKFIVFEVLDTIPFPGTLGIAPTPVEPSLRKCLNHFDSPAAGCVLFSANHLFALKINDSAKLSVASKIFLLFYKPSVLIVATQIDLAVILPVKLLSDQLTVLEIRETVGFAVTVGIFIYTTDLAVFVKDCARAIPGRFWIFLAPYRLTVLIIDPNRRLSGSVGILTFPFDFPVDVKKIPGIHAAIVLAGDLLTPGLARFVIYKDIGLAIEIDILLNLFNLPLPIVVSPSIHLAVAIGISLLADDVAPFIVKETCHGLLACCWTYREE